MPAYPVRETNKIAGLEKLSCISCVESTMLLQMPSWRLKSFISHRRNSGPEDKKLILDTCYTEKQPLITITRRLSWLPQSPPNPLPPEILTLRRSNSSAISPSKDNSPATTTTHSPSSSLCSCECGAHPTTIEHSLFAVQHPPLKPEALYLSPLPPIPPLRSSRGKPVWKTFPSPEVSHSKSQKSPKFPDRSMSHAMSTFDTIQNNEVSPLSDVMTPTQISFDRAAFKKDLLDEEIERLVRGTDESFHAVGSTIAEAKTTTHRWHTTKNSEDAGSRQPHDLNTSNGLHNKHRISNLVGRHPQTPNIKQPKKQKKQKRQRVSNYMMGIGKREPSKQPLNKPPRMRLKDVTHNVSDVFYGKMFRIEADELPNRKQPQRITENDGRKSVESIASTETGGFTPTDPFHLEGLTSRIQAAQRNLPIPPQPTCPPPPIPGLSRSSQAKRRPKRQTHTNIQGEEEIAAISITDIGMIFREHNFPSPPRRQQTPTRELEPEPPTISAQSVLHLSTSRPDNFLTLPSTPFTWTYPLFLHGPIRIEPPELDLSILSPQDEMLDWTAFQMAILGTMDENGGDQRDDWEWEADEREVAGIVDWWETFGFEGYGRLETEGAEQQAVKIRLQDADKEVDIQQESEKEIVDTDPMIKTELGSKTSSFSGYGQGSTCPWVGNSGGMKNRNSTNSLPPSPMLDLAVYSPVYDDEDMKIPMGFNLGHDLGDFLSWETKNVQTYVD